MVSKKATKSNAPTASSSMLALPPASTDAAKPPKPVDMERLSRLSKPKPQKKDPTVRKGPTQIKKLVKIDSKSNLLKQRVKRLSLRQEKALAAETELAKQNGGIGMLALTTGQGEDK